MKRLKLILLILAYTNIVIGQNYVSKVWSADNGDETYKNPILYADYSDPDACRVGDDYYLTSSSFNSIPGLQILHSKDLVNWEIIGAAVPFALPPTSDKLPQQGNRVWAPSIRYHNDTFYIFWGDPDQGIFMTKTKNPKSLWSEPILVKKCKGVIDTTPLWDDDGKVYLVHAYAGSRAGLKSVIAICELNENGDKVITQSRIIYDGHEDNPTCEGPKLYKKNGKYYILLPAGGVATGWQLALRSDNIYGPYQSKVVMAQGKSDVNGPHQGAWVTTTTGEDWFLHFQDLGPYGRVVHLQPMCWKNDWPVIGVDKDNDGCGEPVKTYRKPNVGNKYPIFNPQESDEFNSIEMGKQWQWQANSDDKWAFFDSSRGMVRLYSYPVVDNYKNMWDLPNIMMQKTPAPNFIVTTKLKFSPSDKYIGEKTGLVVMGLDYAAMMIENREDGIYLSQLSCKDADKGNKETEHASIKVDSNNPIYLRAVFKNNDNNPTCIFSYSKDGNRYNLIGNTFKVREGKWVGAKVGIVCYRPSIVTNDGGWSDFDWFRIEN